MLFAFIGSTTDNITAVSFGGSAMTLASKIGPITSDYGVFVYYLANPPTGSQTFSITGGSALTNKLISYTGAQGTIDSSGTGFNNGSALNNQSVSSTVVASNCWILTGSRNDVSADILSASGVASTNRVSTNNTGSPVLYDSNGTVSTGNQTNNLQTNSGSAHWAVVQVSFGPFIPTVPHGAFLINML